MKYLPHILVVFTTIIVAGLTAVSGERPLPAVLYLTCATAAIAHIHIMFLKSRE